MNTTPSHFPLNAWYAAAYDVEVGRSLLARTICNQKMVLYRQTAGAVAALEDACWHRLLPLSMGRLDGDELVCGYHGLVFNAEGRCTHMPSQETLNPSACVRAFPVVEKHRFVWVWPGDPALADPALVPDLHWNHDPDWAADGKMIRVKCDYRLVIDNLMDLTHEAFVHGSSIGNRAVAEAPFVATHGERTATVTRWMEGIEAPPFWAGQIQQARGYVGPVDRWQVIRFEAPCTVSIDVGAAPDRPHGGHRAQRRTRRGPDRDPDPAGGLTMAAVTSSALDAARPDVGVESAQVRALLQLRELILSGELAGGSRIAELAIVERLGVSRTPIRAALMRLEQEGLLEALPNGGYVVQTFSERDIADAIELRGTL
ncbi:MAG: Rieske 2Fe-2S domain-containing protein, partial [Variovorax sp.]|nr:Rieske 2Fe-2S domain-containing protein [Variovorax sp.]